MQSWTIQNQYQKIIWKYEHKLYIQYREQWKLKTNTCRCWTSNILIFYTEKYNQISTEITMKMCKFT